MEIVCHKCGTLNNAQTTMCMRCGEKLEHDKAKRLEHFKGRIISEKIVAFLYIIVFSIYLLATIFYICPWLNNVLIELGNSYIFKFYNDISLTNITLHAIYTLSLFLINYIVILITFDIIMRYKVIKREKVNLFILSIGFYMLVSVALVSLIKFNLDYVYLLKNLISFMAVCPYIKRKMIKRSI